MPAGPLTPTRGRLAAVLALWVFALPAGAQERLPMPADPTMPPPLGDYNLMAIIRQSGDGNLASQVQQGQANAMAIYQLGSGNHAEQNQSGQGNWVMIEQRGDGNTATATQHGVANGLVVQQFGDGHAFGLHQSGTGQALTILQYR